MADDEHREKPPAPAATVQLAITGLRSSVPVNVLYPRSPDELNAILGQLRPAAPELWADPDWQARLQWLGMMGRTCANLHAESMPEGTAFCAPISPPLAIVVLWTTPPIVVMEQPFIVSDEPPPKPKRAILGADGSRIN